MMSQPNPGMPATPGAPPAVVYVQMTVQPKVYDKYLSKQSIVTGIAQIVIGVLCKIFNIVDLKVAIYYSLGTVGHGFWCGIMFIVAGVFGIRAGKHKTKCWIVAYMVLCIISASLTIGLLTVGILGAFLVGKYGSQYYCDDGYRGYYYNYPYYYPPCYNNSYKTAMAMESLLAILGIVEAVIAIYGAAMCCKSGVCCCGTPTPIPVGYTPNNGQMICINQTQVGQPVYVPPTVMSYPPGSVAPSPAYAPNYAQTGWSFPPSQATGYPSTQTSNEYPAPPRHEKF